MNFLRSWLPVIALMLVSAVPAAAQPLFSPSGSRITGSGKIVEVERPLSGFSAVRSRGSINIELRAATRDRVLVRTDDNLVDLIETTVVSGPLTALEIGIKPNTSVRPSRTPVVIVEFTQLQEVTVRGSGDIRADRVQGEQLAVSLAGSGDVRIENLDVGALAVMIAGSGDFRASGRAAQQGFRISGSGDVLAGQLTGDTVKLGIAGSGNATVHAASTLDVQIAGSGDVRYHGSPRITQRIAGSGSVRPAR